MGVSEAGSLATSGWTCGQTRERATFRKGSAARRGSKIHVETNSQMCTVLVECEKNNFGSFHSRCLKIDMAPLDPSHDHTRNEAIENAKPMYFNKQGVTYVLRRIQRQFQYAIRTHF